MWHSIPTKFHTYYPAPPIQILFESKLISAAHLLLRLNHIFNSPFRASATMTTRRSERLRRKRQVTTPGLTQPGAYSLHDIGYTVESEASFLPQTSPPLPTTGINRPSNRVTSPLPANSRRARYRDSPHRFTVDESPVQPDSTVQPDANDLQRNLSDQNSIPPLYTDSTKITTTLVEIAPVGSSVTSDPIPPTASVPPVHNMALPSSSAISAETPPPRRRRAEDTERAVNRMRASLYDILGSATKRPVNPNWRPASFNPSTVTNNAPVVPSIPPVTSAPGTDYQDPAVFDEGNDDDDDYSVEADDSDQPFWSSRLVASCLRTVRRASPVTILLCALVSMLATIIALESAHASRQGRDPMSAVAWRRTVTTCNAVTPPKFWTVLKLAKARASPVAQKFLDWGKYARKILSRKAWPVRTSSMLSTEDVVTRSELEDVILPRFLKAAQDAASSEAARLAQEERDAREALEAAKFVATSVAATSDPLPTDDPFIDFVERFSADKDLPADFALGSAGGAIIATEPSSLTSWTRWVRRYAVSVVTERRFTPLFPRPASVVLDPDVLPGNCWAFEGSRGSLTIRLARPVVVTSVTIEHTPRGSVFSVSSAMRMFQVVGLPLDSEASETNLGQFVFDVVSENKRHLQTFSVAKTMQDTNDAVILRAVRIEILSNYGANHTSIYRVRIHGVEDTSAIVDETET